VLFEVRGELGWSWEGVGEGEPVDNFQRWRVNFVIIDANIDRRRVGMAWEVIIEKSL
jgi:hypothetical protein